MSWTRTGATAAWTGAGRTTRQWGSTKGGQGTDQRACQDDFRAEAVRLCTSADMRINPARASLGLSSPCLLGISCGLSGTPLIDLSLMACPFLSRPLYCCTTLKFPSLFCRAHRTPPPGLCRITLNLFFLLLKHPLINPLFAAMCRVVSCPACGSVDSRAHHHSLVLRLALLRFFSFFLFHLHLDRKCYYYHYHRHIVRQSTTTTPSITSCSFLFFFFISSPPSPSFQHVGLT